MWPQAIGNADLFARQKSLRQPAILRFATDEFMDQFLKLLESDPSRLNELIAKPETWRGAYTEPEPVSQAPVFARKLQRLGLIAARNRNPLALTKTGETALIAKKKAPKLKLYQPAHQRYYLVTSCLVCGRVGLPDKTLAPVRQERVGFVLRRLLPNGQLDIRQPLPELNPDNWQQSWDEYAFVAEQKEAGWKRIPKVSSNNLAGGEEQLPLFAVNFEQDDERRRRLFAGLIPVAKRDAYLNASPVKQTGDPDPAVKPPALPDPRMMIVWSQVTEPWKRLIEQADAARIMQGIKSLATDPPRTFEDKPLSDDATALSASMKATREQIQTGSWYALLDLAKFLEEHIPPVWKKLHGESPLLTTAQTALITALTNTTLETNLRNALRLNTSYDNSKIRTNLKEALTSIRPANTTQAEKIESDLDAVLRSYDRGAPDAMWPGFLFPLADSEHAAPLPPQAAGVVDDPNKLEDRLKRIDRLAQLIETALPEQSAGEAPAIPLAAKPVMDTRDGWFVIRCVFERPSCGPLDPPLLSDPSVPFQMAGFFDPDAPARPIRIGLPIDTTPAGLRKFDKNTAFMISDVLCGQINRMKGVTLGDLVRAVLPWPFHKDLSVPSGGIAPCKDTGDATLSAGMICSFSLPIITLCALIMLMVIVTLLDVIFRWIPYFLICFPLPGFKSKN